MTAAFRSRVRSDGEPEMTTKEMADVKMVQMLFIITRRGLGLAVVPLYEVDEAAVVLVQRAVDLNALARAHSDVAPIRAQL